MSGRYYEHKILAVPTIGKTTVLSPLSGYSLRIEYALAGNSAGSAINVGIGYRVPDAIWKGGRWLDAASTKYTDDTTDAQSSATGDFALGTTTDNDGFVIQASVPFNLVGITVSTAASGGGAAVYTYKYYNGSSWATLNTFAVPDLTSTGDQYLVFLTPADWAKGGATDDGIDSDKYAIRVNWANHPTTAAVASIAWVTAFIDFVENLADHNQNYLPATMGELTLPHGASLTGYFSTADNSNFIEVSYRSTA